MGSYGWYSYLAGNSHHTPNVENKSWLPYPVQLWNLFVCCLFDVRLNFIYQGHKEQFLCGVKQYMIHTEAIYAKHNQAAVGEWFRNDAGAAHTEYIFISGTLYALSNEVHEWLPLAGNCLNSWCVLPRFCRWPFGLIATTASTFCRVSLRASTSLGDFFFCGTIISVYLIKREEKLILWSILIVVVGCFDLADNDETKLSGNEWNVYIGKG